MTTATRASDDGTPRPDGVMLQPDDWMSKPDGRTDSLTTDQGPTDVTE